MKKTLMSMTAASLMAGAVLAETVTFDDAKTGGVPDEGTAGASKPAPAARGEEEPGGRAASVDSAAIAAHPTSEQE